MNWVRLKYRINGSGCYRELDPSVVVRADYFSVGPLMRFEGEYDWTISESVKNYYSPGPCGSEPADGTSLDIEMFVQAQDGAGQYSALEPVASFNPVMEESCGND
jgi:hypothetical protein